MTSSRSRACLGRRIVGVGVAVACLLRLSSASPAHAQLMVVGVDRKFDGAEGKRETLEPGHDELLVFDLNDPAMPALVG